MENKKLYRIEQGKKVCGVCGGIAEYFNIDPTVVRVGWAVVSVFMHVAIIAYVIAAIVMPVKNELM